MEHVYEVGDLVHFQVNFEGEFVENALIWEISDHTITFNKSNQLYVMPRALMEVAEAVELVASYHQILINDTLAIVA